MEKDEAKAKELCWMAHSKGSFLAKSMLFYYSWEGEQAQVYTELVKILSEEPCQLTKLERKMALHMLGYVFHLGIGCEQNYKKAISCYEGVISSEPMVETSFHNLACMIEEKQGFEGVDDEKAIQLYLKAVNVTFISFLAPV